MLLRYRFQIKEANQTFDFDVLVRHQRKFTTTYDKHEIILVITSCNLIILIIYFVRGVVKTGNKQDTFFQATNNYNENENHLTSSVCGSLL